MKILRLEAQSGFELGSMCLLLSLRNTLTCLILGQLLWFFSVIPGCQHLWHTRQRLFFVQTSIEDGFFDMLGQYASDINFVLHNSFQERYQEAQHVVIHVIIPRFNPNAIQRRRGIEVLCQVVNDHRPRQVTTEICEVFDGIILMRSGMLPVQAMCDLTFPVNIV